MWCPKLLNNTDHGGKRKKHQAPLKNWTPLAFSYIKLFGQKSHFFKGERSFEFFRVFKEVLFWGTQKFPNRDFNHRINKKVGCQFSLFWVKIYVSLSFWSEGYSNFGKHKKKKTLGIQTHDHEQLNQCSRLLSNEPMLGAFFQNENQKKNSGAKGRGSGVLKLG